MHNQPFGMRKLESECMLCVQESHSERNGYVAVVLKHDQYAVVVVKYGVVVGL